MTMSVIGLNPAILMNYQYGFWLAESRRRAVSRRPTASTCSVAWAPLQKQQGPIYRSATID